MTDPDGLDPHGTRAMLLDEIARLEAEVERLQAEPDANEVYEWLMHHGVGWVASVPRIKAVLRAVTALRVVTPTPMARTAHGDPGPPPIERRSSFKDYNG